MKRTTEVAKRECRKNQKGRPAGHLLSRLMALIVSICIVFAMLPLPGIMAAQAPELVCPFSCHQHEKTCYGEEGELICGSADFVVHSHDANCYGMDSSLNCKLTQIDAHTHGEACYDSAQTLICEKDEILLHTHTDSCRDENGALICCKLEILEHTHDDDCLAGSVTTQMASPGVEDETASKDIVKTTTKAAVVTEAPVMPAAEDAEVVASGTCGTNVTWTLTDDGVLTISGTGDMTDFASSSKMPWYYNRSKITTVLIENGVTSIGNYAFGYCYNLTSTSIPASVTSIGNYAFYDCYNLTSFTIPDSVTTIGNSAFSYCNGLTDIALSERLISIGDSAFVGCYSLTSIAFPDSLVSIGNSAFQNCTALSSVVFQNGVTTIGNATFRSCTGLTSVIIPDSVTAIGDSAFYECTGLTSIALSDRLAAIGNSAFYRCTGLTSITIPNSVTTIGDSAFYQCTGLTSVIIPGGVTSIGNSAFHYCSGLTSITIPDSVTTIGNSAFFGCSGLTSIAIPDSVISVGDAAFANCNGVTQIEVDTNNPSYCSVDGVLYSKDKTMLLCYPAGKTTPSDVAIPDSVTAIGNYAFYNCSSLTGITIPDNVTSIGDCAFYYCSKLTSITIPDNVTSIGDCVFYYCSKLTSITIPDGVTTIGNYVFYYCSSLTGITIPDGVTTIGDYVFYYCSSLTSITIPDGVTTIGDYAFYDCSSLTSITIPDSVISIGESAFRYCNGLTSVMIPDSVTTIGDCAFFNCTSLTSVTLPNQLTHIAKSTFSACYRLADITIPNSVKYIEDDAFKNCSRLTSIVIPESVTDIYSYAFRSCSNLENVTIENGNVSLRSAPFYQCGKLKQVTIGKNANIITYKILDALDYSSGGLMDISCIGPNYFAYTGSDYAFEKFTLTQGDYYADENGVLYRLNSDGTAALLDGPVYLALEQYEILSTISSEDGTQSYTVTTIGDSAFKNCSALKGVIIPNSITAIEKRAFQGCSSLTAVDIPNGVTILGSFAFCDCNNLASVNGETSLPTVLQTWGGVGADISTFQNTALSEADEIITTGDIILEVGSERKITISTPVPHALTGKDVHTTLTISEDDVDGTDVIRVYFQFVSKYGSINYSVGSHEFDGVSAEVCKANIPYTYYVEFEPLRAEQELNLDLTSVYQNGTSGGNALIWVDAMPEADAEALGNGVTVPIKAHKAVWTTRPDGFKLVHTPFNSTDYPVTIQGDGTAEGEITLRRLAYDINVQRVGTAATCGQDPITGMDYVATLSLPEHFQWRSGLVKAIQDGNWYATIESYGSAFYYYVKISGMPYLFASAWISSGCDAKNLYLTAEEDGEIRIHWAAAIPENKCELAKYEGRLTFGDSVILADGQGLAQAVEEADGTVTCEFVSSVEVTQEFTYSGGQSLSGSATKALSVGATDCTIRGSLSNSSVTMGARTQLTTTVNNPNPLPCTDLEQVKNTLHTYYYVSPADMETMFYSSDYGKDLTITIEGATLCTPVSRTVTGTDGKTYVITQQYEGVNVPYEGTISTGGDGSITASNVSISIGWSEDKAGLVLTVGEESFAISQGGIQEALDGIGYVVTDTATYTCTWDQEGYTLPSGGSRVFQAYITAKSTFMRVTSDTTRNIANTSFSYIYNYVSCHSGSAVDKKGSVYSSVYRDFTLAHSVYLNGEAVNEDTLVKVGDLLTYRSVVTHRDSNFYNALPLVSNLEGAQLLLVSAVENPDLADKGLETMEVEGETFYILNKAGQYKNVKVGELLADRVEVKRTSSGAETMIYWYLTDATGDTTAVTAEYQTLVSPDLAGVATEGESYELKSEVWLNDHQTHRLYDSTVAYGTVLAGIDQQIVTNLSEEELGDLSGHDPSKDLLAERTIVSAGQTVTYRLMLDAQGAGAHTIFGGDMSMVLPKSLASYWSKENVTVTYVSAEGSSVEILNGDSWRLDTTDTKDPSQQYLRWNDDFSATINGILYVYVTLTYPTDTKWSDYCYAYGSAELLSTLQVYNLHDEAANLLYAQTSALLQKGVQYTGVYNPHESYYVNYYRNDSPRFYTNDSYGEGVVTYTVTLYNSGDGRLYLSDIQDVLPKGFTFYGLCYRLTEVDAYYGYSNSNYRSTFSIDDPDRNAEANYKTAYINAKCTESADGNQIVTFSLRNGSSSGNLSYDTTLGKYYLNAGEAVIIAYQCKTNRYGDTDDVATGMAAMPFYDYCNAGINVNVESEVEPWAWSEKDSNNGSRRQVSSSQAALWGMNTTGTDDSTQWLASEVTVHRGSIQPGITKTATSAFANVLDPIAWSIKVSNNGTDDMRDYTLTDVMMSPYQFTGAVTYRLKNDKHTYLYADTSNLFTIGERTYGDETVTIRYGSNKSKVLTINGGYVEIPTSLAVHYGSSSSTGIGITIQVSLSRDENGNEILSIRFPEDSAHTANIPAGGAATLTLQTQNFSGIYKTTSFFNTAYITPSAAQPFDANAISQGNYTAYEDAPSVVSEYSVAVSYGYAAASDITVSELHASNSAASTDNVNYIVLNNDDNPFRYTLEVSNTGGSAVGQAMDLLVLIDNLPQIGDHATLYPEILRFSEFQVNFCENPDFAVSVNGTNLDPDTYSIQFSMATEFSENDLNGTSTDGWYTQEQIDANAEISLANMRSFRVVIRDDTGTVIPADAVVAVSFNAEIDRDSGDIPSAATAWNSFAYHYSLVGSDQALRANPQKVGVRTIGIPHLVKELQDTDGVAYRAKEDTTFRFVIYEGEAVAVLETYTQEDLFSALSGRLFTVVELTVKAGESASETIGLTELYCYRYENGDLVKTDTAWEWENTQNYTILELPMSSDSIYRFDSFDTVNANNYTFAYHSSVSKLLTCVNSCSPWDIQVQKQCLSTGDPLFGAIFGLYSPTAADMISDERFEVLTAQLKKLPQKTLQIGDNVWYLHDIRKSDENGKIDWSYLVEAQYYLLELQAPDGYVLNAQPGQIIQSIPTGEASVTVMNAPGHALPLTGGIGVNMFYIVGVVLMSASLCLGLRKKSRSKAKNNS